MIHKKIVVLFCGAALVLAGCGSKDAAASDSKSAIGGQSAAESSDSSGCAKAEKGDGKITADGAKLKLGQAATFMYETDIASKKFTKVTVAVTCVRKGDKNDLTNFSLNDDQKAGKTLPWFVSVTITNDGPKVLKPFGVTAAVAAISADGDQVSTASLNVTDFKKCDPKYPDTLAAGKSFDTCDNFMVPADTKLGNVQIYAFNGNGAESVSIKWKLAG